MSDRLISRADLTTIERSLASLGQQVSRMSGESSRIAADVAALRAQFEAYLAEDVRQKQLHLAETRLVKVRQEVEERFGFCAEVRRRATGILQALDAGLVTHQSVQDATEEMMISAPGYWLAPALVALAAWIRDDRALAERAVAEAVRRDEYKTSLYFALVLRRYGRRSAAAAWLGRFYAHQRPTELDREFVVLLDAVAGGVFGPEARAITSRHTTEWLDGLSQQAGFVAEQEKRWAAALGSLVPSAPAIACPTLEKASPTWPRLRKSLCTAQVHERMRAYFTDIFQGELAPSPQLRDEVDKLLARLVTEYDPGELPLRATERELQLIVDENGDTAAARQRLEAEKDAFAEKSDFMQLLTNAAMHPKATGATRGTQRYAVALSRDWVLAAYDTVTADARAAVPAEVVIRAGEWEGAVRPTSNEDALVRSARQSCDEKENAEIAEAEKTLGARLTMAVGAGVLLWGLAGGFNFLLVIVGLVFILAGFASIAGRDEAKKKIHARYDALRTEAEAVVRAAFAEAAAARAELARLDAAVEQTRAVLLEISPDQYTLSRAGDPAAAVA